MIIIDFSSIIHRMIHTSIKNAKPKMRDGEFITSEFINLTKYYILQDLFVVYQQYNNKYGEMVIALDDHSKQYWRKDVFPNYKMGRRESRDKSEINYSEVFEGINELIEQIKHNLPWKVLSVPKAEADDIILVLAKTYNTQEKIMIHSPDKDMIQAQRGNNTVQQYSALTKKWLTGDTKSENIDKWVQEHCILGDAGDGVPKVVDHTEFTDVFKEYLKSLLLTNIETPMDFRKLDQPDEFKRSIIENFDVYKTNRKGESTGIRDIYKQIRFGPSTLQKKIKEYGTVENWLNSHPMYQEHYYRNFTLVMEEGIPDFIREECIESYRTAKTDYNNIEFETYLKANNLNSIIMELPNIFKITRTLTADDFGW